MAQSSPLVDVLASFFRPLFVGCLLEICMFGLCLSQTWTYIRFNNDDWPLRAVVGFVFLLVFGCTILDAMVLNYYLIENFGNFLGVLTVAPEITTFTLFGLIITTICDLSFASRIWRLRRAHWGFVIFIGLTAVGTLITGIVLVQGIFRVPTVESLSSLEHMLEVSLINLFAAVSQALSTYCLWVTFRPHANDGPDTPRLLFRRLSSIVVSRGAVLTTTHFILAVLYLARPHQLYWTPFHHILPPLYYMSTVATLNIRNTSRRDDENDSASVINMARSMRPSAMSPRPRTSISQNALALVSLHQSRPSENMTRPTPFLTLHSTDSQASEKHRGLVNSSPATPISGDQADYRESYLSTSSSDIDESKVKSTRFTVLFCHDDNELLVRLLRQALAPAHDPE
ncbi:hypothetical protein V5O48_005367 [Marasmius crinis-equi]|uniref:DUF6534 domain-containing protein n=1 Tax=Marasmius crinis-equi TaxID=585013 RepID=A0ABR3FMG4_9AGAR